MKYFDKNTSQLSMHVLYYNYVTQKKPKTKQIKPNWTLQYTSINFHDIADNKLILL